MVSLIETLELTKCFDDLTAVDSLTLQVQEGEILALLGPNGAGKTTTVRMLSSILRPTRGCARIAGLDVVRDGQQVRHMVGHLTESPGLYLRMRALDYLDFFGELQGMARKERRSRAADLLERFGLGHASKRRLAEFSKGMRQKVALVRALLHNPRVVFLDEPTSAMDPYSAKQVRDAIEELRDACHTVILCTHNLHEAEMLADRIAVIRRGSMIALGKPDELKREFLGPPAWQVTLSCPLDRPWPSMNGHFQLEASEDTWLRYRTTAPEITNPMLLDRLRDSGAQVLTLSELPRSLEQVYLRLIEEQA